MKLRTTHNSIRIRIRKSELNKLAEEREIRERVNFGGQVMFSFCLKIDTSIEKVNGSFKNGDLVVSLPGKTAQTWIATNQVSIEENRALEDGEHLHLLIEKDFPCTDREEEDKSDTFFELVPDKPEAC